MSDEQAPNIIRIDDGWDSIVFDVDDTWIVRVPRRPEVRASLRMEAVLLPLLARELPVRVPEIVFVEDTPEAFVLIHRKLRGDPLRASDEPGLARQVGGFLAALHNFRGVAEAGIAEVSGTEWIAQQAEFAERCQAVLTLLDPAERRRAKSLFDSYLSRAPEFDPVLLHADLGPEHILCRGGSIAGVIDWSDARVGDPALDFAWLLHGPGEAFQDTLLDAYVAEGGRLDSALRERALYFHRLGPWHEVLFGLRAGRPELVESGVAGIRERLA